MRKAKPQQDAKIKNTEHIVRRTKWMRGTITVRSMIDRYPAGDKVTYSMSVSRRGKVIGHTKSGKEIRERTEILELNTFVKGQENIMEERTRYFQSLPEEMETK